MSDSFITDVKYPHPQVQPPNHEHVLLGQGPPEHLSEFTFGAEECKQFIELTTQVNENDPGYDADSDSDYEGDLEYDDVSGCSYPLSQTLSEPDDGDIPEGLECDICGRHQARVRFRGCSHGACIACVKGIWGSQKKFDKHFPTSFPCHQCRAKVTHVSMSREFSWRVFSRKRGKEAPVVEWMAKRSKRVAQGIKKSKLRPIRKTIGLAVPYLVEGPVSRLLGVE